MWYVVSTSDEGLRVFRLDRVEEVEATTEEFQPDTAIAGRVLEEGHVFEWDTARKMTVRYSPRIARWVAEREGKALAADGSLTLEHPVADDSWAIRHVLQYGSEAELLSPPELRALLAQKLDDLSAA
jgi:predicted DNA-binding transcriptional regulator YafY